jgi:hypothetical protein
MRIILFVASITLDRGIVIGIGQVTFLTGHYCMQANQGKLGNIMIETDIGAPATFIVAFVTMFTLLALVDIVQLMAAQTIHLQLDLIDILFMAGCTIYSGMFAP